MPVMLSQTLPIRGVCFYDHHHLHHHCDHLLHQPLNKHVDETLLDLDQIYHYLGNHLNLKKKTIQEKKFINFMCFRFNWIELILPIIRRTMVTAFRFKRWNYSSKWNKKQKFWKMSFVTKKINKNTNKISSF